MLDEEKFKRIKEEVEILYKSLGDIYCPYFKEKIAFNHKGLEHLEFKGNNIIRSLKDQYRRLKIFKYSPIIISISHTVQAISHAKSFEYTKINSRWEYVLKDITYYDFIAVIEGHRIRVTLKQIENSNKYFWSIIPYDKKESTDP